MPRWPYRLPRGSGGDCVIRSRDNVVERRNLAPRIDRLEPVAVMLELGGIELIVLETQALFVQGKQGLQRVGAWSETVQLEHLISPGSRRT